MDFTWSSESGDISAVNVTSPITGGGSSGAVTIGIDSTAVVPSQTGNSGKFLTTNGSTSSWGTVSAPTAIAGAYATVATQESTSSGSYTDLTTSGPAVTVTTGTKALVIFGASMRSTVSGANAQMSFAVSGATTRAVQTNEYANTAFGTGTLNGINVTAEAAIVVTGLTAGSNTFTSKYATPGGDSCSFQYRKITVIDLGS